MIKVPISLLDRSFDRLNHLKPFKFWTAQIKRPVIAGTAMSGTECLRLRPAFKCRMVRP